MEESTNRKVIDLKDFFRNPEKNNFKISPSGSHLAYLAPVNSRMNLFVQSTNSDSVYQLTNVDDRDIAGYLWASDNRLLYLKDNGGDENFGLYGVNIDGSNLVSLTAFDGVKTDIIDNLDELDDFILVGLNKRDPRIFDPYRLNINSGELTMLYENPGNISSWLTDHNGKLRVATTTDGVNTTLLYRESEEQDFKEVITTDFTESLAPMFFDFDNQSIYALSNIGRDKQAIVRINPATAEEIELVFEHPEVDAAYLAYSKLRKTITAAVYETDKTHLHFFDNTTRDLYNTLQSQLPGYEVSLVSKNKAEDKFIVRTYSDRSLGNYYTYDLTSGELTLLAAVSPWLQEEDLAEMKPISFTSRDGLTINGYLTLPKGVDPKNLPVVVNPHGGPWARDSWGFNPEVQFLANRGYAVLQINFRGSTGYGKSFWKASFKQWGQAMQNDITDGVNWLIGQGVADSSRIAIYGASYGGYATLAGLTYTPDLYACGIDYVGVSSLFTFMETIPPYWEQYLQMLYTMVGHPQTDSAMLAQYSPALNAHLIKKPLFIAQGANDPRVKKSESDQMVEALKNKGIEVEYMVKNNEGHGFGNEENQFDFYAKMEQFLAQHLSNKSHETLEN